MLAYRHLSHNAVLLSLGPIILIIAGGKRRSPNPGDGTTALGTNNVIGMIQRKPRPYLLLALAPTVRLIGGRVTS